VWLGFLAVLVIPSPKCHCQEIGEFVDVSVNWIGCPVIGDAGLYVNDAAVAAVEADGITVIVRLFVLDPVLLPAVRLTL
jgi:hypothetical protein